MGSADMDASMCHNIRTMPALLHCASHWQDNTAVQARPSAQREGVAWNRLLGVTGFSYSTSSNVPVRTSPLRT
jgi:hypothetical protein